MRVHILTLFPDIFSPYLDTSIMRKGKESGNFGYILHNLCDYSVRTTRRVDDRPYGGGAGTLLCVEPLYAAISHICSTYGDMDMVYFSPRGTEMTQPLCTTHASIYHDRDILLICGHYEGVDERIFDLFHIQHISIGQYVLSSGELAALVYIDSIVRLLPGVISTESLVDESFSPALDGQKEYPQYTRPDIFQNLCVPADLVSGDHVRIAAWKADNRGEV
jgi:tRNA (guanine37-N1)-methyltransferase